MVLGETGLGKSTLINSLFLGDLYKDRRIPDAAGAFLIYSYNLRASKNHRLVIMQSDVIEIITSSPRDRGVNSEGGWSPPSDIFRTLSTSY